ncbi:dnaJ homolog subfamily C member 4-like isoform X2 [Diachasmimorpha longicaudata]|uniref:dnaJ homolog subfamily C member 4-like isoform X2 n=1 Tax=Diachasmimorpha longicaudata TaxID=58733 RepID=UPI0030B8F681
MYPVYRFLKVVGYHKHAQRYYAARSCPLQVHPDTGNKSGHTEFIRATEAYNILSKESTRREYDEFLNTRHRRRHTRYYPDEPTIVHHRASRFEQWRDDNIRRYSQNPYGTDTRTHRQPYPFRRFSKAQIVMICIIVSVTSFFAQMMAVVKSPTFDRGKMLERSTAYNTELQQLQEKANNCQSREKSVEAFLSPINDTPK